jgi:endonuclease/exonuclease/phosphatase family metal-dependent hydrolase
MTFRPRSLTGRATAAAATLSILLTPLLVAPSHAQTTGTTTAPAHVPALRVMTRNLYLGTDIMRPIVAVQGKTDQLEILQALGNATDTARGIVDQTDFRVRSRLLARELVAQKPDLVGLQEVALWRHGPMELSLDKLGVPNATTVDYDFLKLLLGQLRAQGVRYRAVSVNWLSDVEAPAFSGPLNAMQNPRDVRLTMRDVILKRVGSDLDILDHHEKKYRHGLKVTIAGKTMNFQRGYNWVDVQRGTHKFRFINTHLEAFSSDMAYQQVGEMLRGPGDADRTTIIVCDCNSDPLNNTVKSAPPVGDTLPHSAPYWLVTGKTDFTDTWLQWRPGPAGFTSGLSEPVNDSTPAGFDHRIDMVFARTGDGRRLKVVGGAVTGRSLSDRDPVTGLWPSDHAGVVMRLRHLS